MLLVSEFDGMQENTPEWRASARAINKEDTVTPGRGACWLKRMRTFARAFARELSAPALWRSSSASASLAAWSNRLPGEPDGEDSETSTSWKLSFFIHENKM